MIKKIIVSVLALSCVSPLMANKNTLTDAQFSELINSANSQVKALPNIQASSRYISTRQLKDLLTDRDPEIRKMAVKNSRMMIINPSIYNLVLDIFENSSEDINIRVEAARVLSYAVGAPRVQSKLIDSLKYGNNPEQLKVMTYKALWRAAKMSSRVWNFLLDAIKYNEETTELKKAAIWATFAASPNSRVYSALIDIVKYDRDESLKLEAVKSLYRAMGNYKVKSVILDIAKYDNHPKELRKTAIFALSNSNADSRVKRVLENLVKYANDNEIKEAALEAETADKFMINKFFHLDYKLANGGVFNPIANE